MTLKSKFPRLYNRSFRDPNIEKSKTNLFIYLFNSKMMTPRPKFDLKFKKTRKVLHQKRNHTSLHSSSSFDQNLLPHLDFAIFTAPSHLFQWRRLMKTFSPFPENNFQLSPSCNSTERIHQIDDSIDIGRNWEEFEKGLNRHMVTGKD